MQLPLVDPNICLMLDQLRSKFGSEIAVSARIAYEYRHFRLPVGIIFIIKDMASGTLVDDETERPEN